MMLDFTLHPLNITINQVSIGNKKLTKSIFNQIEGSDCFDVDLDFIGDNLIGYIKDKDSRYLLWIKRGKLRKTNISLRKTNISRYYRLERSPGFAELHKTEWFLDQIGMEYSVDQRDRFDIRVDRVISDEDKEIYSQMVDKVDKFLDTLADRQIYL